MAGSSSNNKKKTNNKKDKKSAGTGTTASSQPPGQQQRATNNNNNNDILMNETLSQVFWKHPLIRVIPYVLLPYVIYHTMYYVSLQSPNIVTTLTLGIWKLRPIVHPTNDMKQVLILGSEINENKHLANGLAHRSTLLNLEIGLETTNTFSYFCRDGTISWFHVMRYIKKRPWNMIELNTAAAATSDNQNGNVIDNPDEAKKQKLQEIQYNAWKELCIDRTEGLVGLFHPKHQIQSQCSSKSWIPSFGRDEWSHCYARECLKIVNNMWGCAWKELEEEDGDHEDTGDESTKGCLPQFTKVLHQVRHPLRTIEKLNATFCGGNNDDDASREKYRTSFISLISSWFPFEEGRTEGKLQLRDYSALSCLDTMGVYVVEFHTTLLHAYDDGLVHGRFQIETTSPCEVVNMGGFLNPTTVLYEPNLQKVSKQCLLDYEYYGGDDLDSSSSEQLHQQSSSSKKEKELSSSRPQSKSRFTEIKAQNEGDKKKGKEDYGKKLTLDDFQHNPKLMKQLQDLIVKLGYDNDNDDGDGSGGGGDSSGARQHQRQQQQDTEF